MNNPDKAAEKPRDFEDYDAELGGYVEDTRYHDGSGTLSWLIIAGVLAVIVAIFALCPISCHAQDEEMAVDLRVLAQIESSNNPEAVNERTGATGLYQFTKIAWLDVQNRRAENARLPFSYARKPSEARKAAKEYLLIIKGYLRHFGLKTTVHNQLWAWNAGIGNVRKGIKPAETRAFITKYEEASK